MNSYQKGILAAWGSLFLLSMIISAVELYFIDSPIEEIILNRLIPMAIMFPICGILYYVARDRNIPPEL